MKKINLIYIIPVILGLLFCACPAQVPPIPLVIYKTNADYFSYVNIRSDSLRRMDYLPHNYSLSIIDGDTSVEGRYRLINDYVLTNFPPDPDDYFTDITWSEFIQFKPVSENTYRQDYLIGRVIDKKPFKEFWLAKETEGDFDPEHPNIDRINEIIRNGEIEDYFESWKSQIPYLN